MTSKLTSSGKATAPVAGSTTLAAGDIAVRLGTRQVLSGVTLACGHGRITGLIGPNGAGKSTLLRALAGLLPLAAGAVTIEGQPVAAMSPGERGRSLAYLPQERTVHWPLAVRHLIALGRMPHRGDRTSAPARDAAAIDHAMTAMDVRDLADRPVAELSGGEVARVLFARVLAQEAPIILADEPTAGLDPAHALALLEVLQSLASRGHTIVLALHDLSLAARFCHEVVMMLDGRVVANGPPGEVLTPARLESVLGVRMAVGTVAGVPVVVPIARIPAH